MPAKLTLRSSLALLFLLCATSVGRGQFNDGLTCDYYTGTAFGTTMATRGTPATRAGTAFISTELG